MAQSTRRAAEELDRGKRLVEDDRGGKRRDDGFGAIGDAGDHRGDAGERHELQHESDHVTPDGRRDRERRQGERRGRRESADGGSDQRCDRQHQQVNPKGLRDKTGTLRAGGGEELGRGRDARPHRQRDPAPVDVLEGGAHDEKHAEERQGDDAEERRCQRRALDHGTEENDQDRKGVEHHDRDSDRDEGHGREIAQAHEGRRDPEQADRAPLVPGHGERVPQQESRGADDREHERDPVHHQACPAHPREGGEPRKTDVETEKRGRAEREGKTGQRGGEHGAARFSEPHRSPDRDRMQGPMSGAGRGHRPAYAREDTVVRFSRSGLPACLNWSWCPTAPSPRPLRRASTWRSSSLHPWASKSPSAARPP